MLPLVIFDLDGTLIGESGHVSNPIWDAIENAKEKGMRFAVCTGRPGFGLAKKIADRLGNNHPHIFQNGAQVSYASGDICKLSAIKSGATKELIEHARDNNLTLELYTPSSLFVEKKTKVSEAHAKMLGVNAMVKDLEDVLETEPVIRAQWVIPKALLDKALECSPEGTQHSVATSPAEIHTYFVSVTKKGVTKGSAVLDLCERLKVDAAAVMAVGDSEGDVPMLEVVGFPRLMQNAAEGLADSYPRSSKSVDNNGALELIAEALDLSV